MRGAEVNEIQPGVIRSGDPDIAPSAAIGGHIPPAGVFGRARLRQRCRSPEFLAGLGVMAGNEAAILCKQLTAVNTTHDDTIGHNGPRAVGISLAIVGFLSAPAFFSGCRIDGYNGRVIGRQKEAVLPQCDIAGGPAKHPGGRGELVLIFPDQFTGCGLDRLNLIVSMGQEHDLVPHQRGGLVAALVHGH